MLNAEDQNHFNTNVLNNQIDLNATITNFTMHSVLDDMVQEHIKNVILANIIPPHIEWAKVSRNQIHSRTAENYIHLLRKHFLMPFTGRQVGSIATLELQCHFNKLAQTHGNSVLVKVHFLANRMFRRAEKRWGINNPFTCEDFILPVSEKRDRKVEHYSDEEMLQLLSGVEEHPILKPIINLTAATGCRIQEILNLKWQHVNLDTGRIRIERALTLSVEFDKNGNTLRRQTVDGRTKRRSSERTLFIDEYTAELIRQWKEYAAIHTKTRFGLHDYVFGNSQNDHYTYGGFRSVLNRFLEYKYNKKHGLAALHRIRHTVATKAAEEGASTIELMQLLGDNQERSVLRYTGRSQTIAMKNRDRISKSMKALIRVI